MKGLLSIVALLLVLYALIDCVRADRSELRTLPRAVWVVLIVLLPVAGALAYLLTGRRRGPAAPPQRRGPVAPDDDPDFLWRLEQERRRSRGTNPEGPRRPGEDGAPTG